MKALVAFVALAAPLAYAQPNIEAGKAKVATVCAACHGLNGVSVSDTIPNRLTFIFPRALQCHHSRGRSRKSAAPRRGSAVPGTVS